MGNSSLEKDADIYGLFLCYIAGYNSLKFVPEILNSIYKDYGLINRKIYGYPTLQERIRSHESVEYSVNSLINLHKFSGYLISINELEYAYDCINYLTSIHKTKEVENNLGLLKLLTAIQTCHIESIDKFFFPIFLEDKSPFENKKMYRADTLFNSEFEKKLQLRNKLLKQAIHYFDLALARDKNYESAHINKNIAIILQGDLIESISYISELSNYTKFNNNNSLKLLNTISLFLVGKIDSITAKNELYLLLNNAKNRLDSSLILANIQQFEKQKPKYKPSLQLPIDCEISLGMLQPNISGTRNKLIINKKNQLAFIWSKQGAGITYAFEKNGNRIITIKNYPLPEHDPILLDAEIASNPDKFMNLLYTPNGFIIHNPIEQYLVKCTTNGVVKDLIKYFK
ncbi:MAG: hypothetical protein IPL31_04375 [Saprospiraceae bacterium]|nr:hypothetical protein [Saprospiraceae bacterium]